MKRMILTVTGTVAGVAALLSFKTQTHSVAGALPSAGAAAATGGSATSTSVPTNPTSTSSTAPTASGSTAAKATTYTGQSVTTRYGIVQVKVTVAAGRITDVAFVQLTAFDGRSEQINSYAGPQLLQETLKDQTAQVDTVSGATYTSDGYRESLQSALDQAGLK